MEPGIYLLKVSLCLLAFYVLYQAIFRHTTFFIINRIYLLAGLLLSVLIPVLEISLWDDSYQQVFTTDFSAPSTNQSHHTYHPDVSVSGTSESGNYYVLFYYLYFAGVAIMLTRLLYSLYKIYRISRNAIPVKDGKFNVFKTRLSQPFTFLNFIFLPYYEIDSSIAAHEKVHARQLHSVDILLVEIIHLFLWFNPLVTLYKKAIKEQHEYLADWHTIGSSINIEQYLAVMLAQIQRENQINVISGFYSKSIKNRIIMITKNRTSLKFASLYLALIPVCCMLLFAFANRNNSSQTDTQSSVSLPVVIIDPGHGGSDHGTSSGNGAIEKELTLAIARQIKKIGKERGITIVLTRAEDVTLPLQERTRMADKFAGEMFISLHINSNTDISRNGIDCIVSENNIATEQSLAFGNVLLDEFEELKGIGVNGIKKSNAFVLKNSSIPAVALELGYLSNKTDNAFLIKEENQKLISEKIVSSVVSYFN